MNMLIAPRGALQAEIVDLSGQSAAEQKREAARRREAAVMEPLRSGPWPAGACHAAVPGAGSPRVHPQRPPHRPRRLVVRRARARPDAHLRRPVQRPRHGSTCRRSTASATMHWASTIRRWPNRRRPTSATGVGVRPWRAHARPATDRPRRSVRTFASRRGLAHRARARGIGTQARRCQRHEPVRDDVRPVRCPDVAPGVRRGRARSSSACRRRARRRAMPTSWSATA